MVRMVAPQITTGYMTIDHKPVYILNQDHMDMQTNHFQKREVFCNPVGKSLESLN